MVRRGPKAWLGLGIRGMAMGAADLVPGVSGGTVAFIAGIYEELLTTIGGLGLGTLRALFREGPLATWRQYNLGFIAVLAAGIGTSVLLLAGLLHHLIETEPVLLWAFFFGLVAASIPLMLRAIAPEDRRRPAAMGMLALGAGIAWWITGLPPLVQGDAPLFLFCSGAIAICAMILPGISGSFILVLLGAYSAVIGAIKGLDLVRVAAFGAGAVTGLLAFTKGLGWVFRQHRAMALALLSGFLLGSLRKLWPWKENLQLLFVHSDGREEHLQANVMPSAHPDPEVALSIACAVAGVALVTLLSRWGQRAEE